VDAPFSRSPDLPSYRVQSPQRDFPCRSVRRCPCPLSSVSAISARASHASAQKKLAAAPTASPYSHSNANAVRSRLKLHPKHLSSFLAGTHWPSLTTKKKRRGWGPRDDRLSAQQESLSPCSAPQTIGLSEWTLLHATRHWPHEQRPAPLIPPPFGSWYFDGAHQT
jgi:hypothetical protein